MIGILDIGLGVPARNDSVALEMSLVKSVMTIGILGIGFGALTNDVSVALACPWCALVIDYLMALGWRMALAVCTNARPGNAPGRMHCPLQGRLPLHSVLVCMSLVSLVFLSWVWQTSYPAGRCCILPFPPVG